MSSTPRYYYVDAQNQAAGPIPMPELQSLQASGTITDSTLVVIEGGQDWVAFSTLRPSAQPAPQAAASVTIAPKPAPTSSTPSSQSEPAWATQLL
ncbi:MAG: DUF4339 domain-containing protein, partial [Verrucomicrobia bacterium]|nr:DUF4339 domain-containing protein [Verrucomicrobiota bacterium]